MASPNEERRRYTRYSNADLKLEVHRPGIRGMLRLNPTADCMNFSLAGIEFGTQQQLGVGESLVIDIGLGDIYLTEIPCIVRSCRRHQDHWCCVMQFDLDHRHMKRNNVIHSLLRIEEYLRSYEQYPDVSAS